MWLGTDWQNILAERDEVNRLRWLGQAVRIGEHTIKVVYFIFRPAHGLEEATWKRSNVDRENVKPTWVVSHVALGLGSKRPVKRQIGNTDRYRNAS